MMINRLIKMILMITLAFYMSVPAYVEENSVTITSKLGMQLSYKENQLKIIHILPDSLLGKMGVKTGDSIIEMNVEPTVKLTQEDINRLLNPEQANDLMIIIERQGPNGPENFEKIIIRNQMDEYLKQAKTYTVTAYTPMNPSSQPTLILFPLTGKVTTGQSYALDIVLDNPQGLMSDELAFWIQYEPKVLDIKTMKKELIFAENTILNDWSIVSTSVTPDTGDIFAYLKSKEPKSPLVGKIGEVLFHVKGKTSTSIKYKFGKKDSIPNTFLSYKKKDVLGKNTDLTDGTIGASIQIIPVEK